MNVYPIGPTTNPADLTELTYLEVINLENNSHRDIAGLEAMDPGEFDAKLTTEPELFAPILRIIWDAFKRRLS